MRASRKGSFIGSARPIVKKQTGKTAEKLPKMESAQIVKRPKTLWSILGRLFFPPSASYSWA